MLPKINIDKTPSAQHIRRAALEITHTHTQTHAYMRTGSLRNTCLPYKIGNKMKHKHHCWICLFKWRLSQILSYSVFVILGLKFRK